MEGFFRLRKMSDSELKSLLNEVTAELALRAKRNHERKSLPSDHRTVRVIVDDLAEGSFWRPIMDRIRLVLDKYDIRSDNIYVDTHERMCATVRFELPSDAQRSLAPLKSEFPDSRVYVAKNY